jgi:hypothetical protein
MLSIERTEFASTDRSRMPLLAHVYSVLAFAELLMLFASIVGVIVFAVRCAVGAVDRFIEAAVDASARDGEPGVRKPLRLNVAAEAGSRRIPGGHNERF